MFDLSELARRQENLIRIGTIAGVDTATARAKVKIGDNLSTWLPWLEIRAGADRTWWAPDTGEQVLILSPSGEFNNGVILCALYSTAHPAPSNTAEKRVVTYGDGATFTYDKATHRYTLTIPAGGEIFLKAGRSTLSLTDTQTTLTTPAFHGQIAVAAFLVWKKWDWLAEKFNGVWTTIKTAFSGGLAGIATTLINWSPLGLFYKLFATALNSLGIELPSTFTEFGRSIVQGLVEGILQGATGIGDALGKLAGKMKTAFRNLLGIRSPSREFIKLGGFISEGLALGVSQGEQKAVTAVRSLGQALPRIVTAGALSIAPVPAYAGGGTANLPAAGEHIEIHVHAAPGMDPHELAHLVRQELENRDREKAARTRSRLYDDI